MMLIFATALLLGTAQVAVISPGGIEAIGPKQDDPRTACDPATGERGIVVQGGIEAIGPKQDDPRKLAIGPKQDDPLTPGVLARPGDDDDPKASGGAGGSNIVVQGGIIVQGGIEAIGPKQDDPRSPALKVGALARPGDDEDPQARACAPAKG